MRNTKPLIILSSLAISVAADGQMVRLDPVDVPVPCAKICGPVVELTGICHIGSHDSMQRRLKRRKLELLGRRGNGQGGSEERRELYRRQFVTNAFGQRVPAPATAPGGPARTVTQVITKTAAAAAAPQATRLGDLAGGVAAVDYGGDVVVDGALDAGDDDDEGLPPLTPSPTPIAVGNAVGGDAAGGGMGLDLTGNTDFMDDMHAQTHKKESEAIEQAEEQCICLNDSFDVPLVSALCSSCIEQTGDVTGPMKIVMAQCNFTEEKYEKSRDSVVFNVRVEASRPTLDVNNALISDSPPSPRLQTRFVGAVVAGVACGIAMML